jgi:hypothetical protein
MDLSKVKLKHVQHVEKAPVAAADGGEELRVVMARVRECDLDVWYDRLKHVTFATEFIPLSRDDAKTMCSAYKQKTGATAVLPHLVERLDAAIARFGGVAFVKLSSRSPKDATVGGEETRALFLKHLACSAEQDDNAKFVSLNRAHIDALAVRSGTSALGLLLRSERIFDDLELALESEGWNQHLVVRQWIDMPLSCEYRGFVHNGQLTALSQYFAPCFFAELQSEEAQSRAVNSARALVEKIRNLLPSAVVADFAVQSDGSALLLEINPFNNYPGCGTSACLFDWRADREVLEGRAPFELRIVREKSANLKALVGQEWKQYF